MNPESPNKLDQQTAGVLIHGVDADSIAEEVGLAAGDRLLAINDRMIEDVLDYRYIASTVESELTLRVLKAFGEVWEIEIEKDEDEDLGLELEGIQTRICKNNCIFCFVHQLPRGKHIRRTLRVKDEDFRLSFLFGHYLTLTNLSEDDFQRIFEQRLSPLYVSVHATDPALRKYLLQSQIPDDLLGNMRRLVDGGIQLHTQVVLIPGINDGMNLERTLHDLRQFYPSVMSVSIVPVGLTDHRKGLPQLRSVDAAYAADAIAHVEQIQQKNKSEIGVPFCFLGDEFYIKAGHPIPPRSHYGDFPLVENGVGMIRNFLDEFAETMSLDWTPTSGFASPGNGRHRSPLLPDSQGMRRSDEHQIPNRPALPAGGESFPRQRDYSCRAACGSDIYASVQNQMYGDYLILPSECMTGEKGYSWMTGFKLTWKLASRNRPLAGVIHVADFFKLIFSDRQIR